MKDRAYTKSRLLKELAYKVGVKKALSQKILDALAEIIYREAGIGGFVLPGVCKIDVVERKARKIRNPRTGEVLVLPSHKALRATLSNIAKRAIAPRPKTISLAEYEAQLAATAAVESVTAESVTPAPEVAPEAAEPVAEAETPAPEATPEAAEPVVEAETPAPEATPEAAEPVAEAETPAPEATLEAAEPVSEAETPAPEAAPEAAEPIAEAETPAPEATPKAAEPVVEAETPVPEATPKAAEPVAEAETPAPEATPETAEPAAEAETPAPEVAPEAAVPAAETMTPVPEAAEPAVVASEAPEAVETSAEAVSTMKDVDDVAPADKPDEDAKPISVKPPTGESMPTANEPEVTPALTEVTPALTEEPKAEEPKTEEPKADEPKVVEPKVEEPKAEEPKAEEPKADEPKVEEPKAEEPKVEETKVEEPKPTGPVSFRCPGCGQEIEAPAEAIGFEAECPMCGRIVVVPKVSEPGTMYGPVIEGAEQRPVEPVVTAEEAEDMDPLALKNRTIRIDTTLLGFGDEDDYQPPRQQSSQPATEEKLVSFFCKKCHQEIEATMDMCGSQGECPNCGAAFVVPYFSDPGSVHDESAEKMREQQRKAAQKHSTMRINLDEF